MDALTQFFFSDLSYCIWTLCNEDLVDAKIGKRIKPKDGTDYYNVYTSRGTRIIYASKIEFYRELLKDGNVSEKVQMLMDQQWGMERAIDNGPGFFMDHRVVLERAMDNRASYIPHIFTAFFKRGVDPNQRTKDARIIGTNELIRGESLLDLAIKKRYPEVIETCLAYGGTIDLSQFEDEDLQYAKAFDIPDTKGVIIEDLE